MPGHTSFQTKSASMGIFQNFANWEDLHFPLSPSDVTEKKRVEVLHLSMFLLHVHIKQMYL